MTQDYTFNVHFHLDGIPKGIPDAVRQVIIDDYVEVRHEICDIFNERIESINKAWDRTGKSATLDASSNFAEDINPEYSKFINSYFTEDIEKINKHHVVKGFLDEISDICGTLPCVPGSKIWITLEPVK